MFAIAIYIVLKSLLTYAFYIINSNRNYRVYEPGLVYEKLVVGPIIIAVCSKEDDIDTILSFGLDFFDQDNSK